MAPSLLDEVLLGTELIATAAAAVVAPEIFPVLVETTSAAFADLAAEGVLLSTAEAADITAFAASSEPFFYAGTVAPFATASAATIAARGMESNKASTSSSSTKDSGVVTNNATGVKDYTPDIPGAAGIRYHDPSVPVRTVLQPKGLLALPFSIWAGSLSVKGNSTNAFVGFSLETNPGMREILRPYRFAKVAHAEVVVMPTQMVTLAPLQIDITWTPDNIPDLSYNEQIGRMSHTRAVWVPAVSTPSNFIVPAPLHNLNPVVKDSISYNDTPKAHVALWATQLNNVTNDTVMAHVVVRGTVWVGAPSLY